MAPRLSQHRGAENSVEFLLETMVKKDYSGSLRQNNEAVQAIAQTLAHEGALDNLLEASKLEEYRDSVKKLAARNVESDRQVRAYVQALKMIQQQQDNADTSVDYSKMLKENIGRVQKEITKNSVEIHQEEMYRKVMDVLNEPGAGSANAEDDDIAVIPTQGGGNNLKCPITTMLMENPYRNKVCGHTYEYDAILNHLRKDRRGRCPVAGCNCQNITEAQLEKDARTANLIRREKVRRQRAQDLQRATQDTIDMDEEDDE